jgi:hypothetical protein
LDIIPQLFCYGVFGLVTLSLLYSAFVRSEQQTFKDLRLPFLIMGITGGLVVLLQYLNARRENAPVLFAAYYDGDINGASIRLRTDGSYEASSASVLGGDVLYGSYRLVGDTIHLEKADYRVDDAEWEFSRHLLIGPDSVVRMIESMPSKGWFTLRILQDDRPSRLRH